MLVHLHTSLNLLYGLQIMNHIWHPSQYFKGFWFSLLTLTHQAPHTCIRKIIKTKIKIYLYLGIKGRKIGYNNVGDAIPCHIV